MGSTDGLSKSHIPDGLVLGVGRFLRGEDAKQMERRAFLAGSAIIAASAGCADANAAARVPLTDTAMSSVVDLHSGGALPEGPDAEFARSHASLVPAPGAVSVYFAPGFAAIAGQVSLPDADLRSPWMTFSGHGGQMQVSLLVSDLRIAFDLHARATRTLPITAARSGVPVFGQDCLVETADNHANRSDDNPDTVFAGTCVAAPYRAAMMALYLSAPQNYFAGFEMPLSEQIAQNRRTTLPFYRRLYENLVADAAKAIPASQGQASPPWWTAAWERAVSV